MYQVLQPFMNGATNIHQYVYRFKGFIGTSSLSVEYALLNFVLYCIFSIYSAYTNIKSIQTETCMTYNTHKQVVYLCQWIQAVLCTIQKVASYSIDYFPEFSNDVSTNATQLIDIYNLFIPYCNQKHILCGGQLQVLLHQHHTWITEVLEYTTQLLHFMRQSSKLNGQCKGNATFVSVADNAVGSEVANVVGSVAVSVADNVMSSEVVSVADNEVANAVGSEVVSVADSVADNVLTGLYHPLLATKSIKNTIKMDKHSIITGTNASGKTTLLKAMMISYVLSQQFGIGYYKSANLQIMQQFSAYLSFPTVVGRESLFQAEAIQCKKMLEQMMTADTFCIFDEFFSGTNPREAVSASVAVINYICNLPNKSLFCLTTHFNDICIDHAKIQLKQMKSYVNNDALVHSYKVKKGICMEQGGMHILRELQFPFM